MRTLRLTLAYDGTAFSGWQVQPQRRSVQQVVERAIEALTGERVKVAASGRTDAGVHALAQVVSFQTATSIPVEGYRWGLVTKLPDDVVVTAAEEVPDGFHARFDTVRKTYRYVIHAARTPTPWLRHYVWWHRGPLDVAAMQAGADLLIGTHDFRCFETEWPNRSSSVRTIDAAKWSVVETWDPWRTGTPSVPTSDHPESRFLCFDITADGFLYNMVRAIVGTLIPLGRGRASVEDIAKLLTDGTRDDAGDTAPAQGLYLAEVETVIDLDRIAHRRAARAARIADAEVSEEDSGTAEPES